MLCLVGLGNPGPKYENTRHNAGFLVIDQILDELKIPTKNTGKSVLGKTKYQGTDLLLVKPQTYMNCSGEAVRELVDYYKIDLKQVLIIYDDLDLKLGAIRFRPAGSSGGHRGLSSVIDFLKTNQISRLRLGIGRPSDGRPIVDYVLMPVAETERELFKQSINRGAAAALAFVTQGPLYVMNHFNTG